jgi:UDP-glucose 4-epimerase
MLELTVPTPRATERTWPSLAGARVMVTGAAGFIGQHLVRGLVASGAGQVIAVDLRPIPGSGAAGSPIIAVAGRAIGESIADLLSGVDVVFHLAAQTSVPQSVEDPLNDASVNTMGTIAVLESCRKVRVERVVYSSSAAVYGMPIYLPVDEAHPTRPMSPYGLSKLTGERYALLYSELYGLRPVALRYFNVYGPGQPVGGSYAGVVTLFLDRVRRSLPLPIEGDGSHTRDFVHVDDVVWANLAAATSAASGILNIASGVPCSVDELAQIIGGEGYPREQRPPRLGDISYSVASIGAARAALGFEPGVRLGDGLRELKGSE